jgi:hypothetical protein
MLPALRDISLIILIVPMLLCLLIPLALLGGSTWLLHKGGRALRPRLQTVHRTLQQVDDRVDQASHKVISPFVWIEMHGVMLQTWWRGLRR